MALSTSSYAVTFTKLFSTDQLPGQASTVGSIQLNGNVVVFNTNFEGGKGFASIWSININNGLSSLVRLVDSNTPIPQGIGDFSGIHSLANVSPIISGDKVFFDYYNYSDQSGFYSVPVAGGAITALINQSTQMPGATAGTFLGSFLPLTLSVNQNDVLVQLSHGRATPSSYKLDTASGALSPIFNPEESHGDRDIDVSSNFLTMFVTQRKSVSYDAKAIRAIVAAPYSDMVNYDPDNFDLSSPYVIASGNDVVPGTETNPRTFDPGPATASYFGNPKIDGSSVVFSGTAKPITAPGIANDSHDLWGLYSTAIGSGRKMSKLADTLTAVPGGVGNFHSITFNPGRKYLISGKNVVFSGIDTVGDPKDHKQGNLGLYLSSINGDSLTKIVAPGDTLADGTTVKGIGNFALSGNRLVWQLLENESTSSIYLATLDDNAGNGGNTGGNGGRTSSGTTPIIGQTESADQVPVNQPFSYTVSFTNNAPSVATSVKLTDKLPKKTKLVSAVTSLGKKCKGKAPVVCNFGTVASGTNVTATITVTRKKPGSVKNSAVITYKMVRAGTKKKKSYRLVSSESTTVN